MNGRRLDLVDLVHELTQNTQHRELYMRKHKPRYHTTNNPPLLEQLQRSAFPSFVQLDGAGKVASSKPSANIDALDAANLIHTRATTWLTDLGADTTGTTIDLIRRLGALAPNQDHCGRRGPERDPKTHQVICCTHHRIEADIRRWWNWARTITGWDLPAWQPANTCPACGERGTLRIRLVEKLATCRECWATWDDTTIGLLADHIRTENGDTGHHGQAS